MNDELPAARSYTLRIYNTANPETVRINGEASSDFSYDSEARLTVVEVPAYGCDETGNVEITEASSSLTEALDNRPRISYDKDSDTLIADLGQNRKEVELSMFNIAGTQCFKQKYHNVSRFVEKLTMLAPQVYVCKIKADEYVTTEKILK